MILVGGLILGRRAADYGTPRMLGHALMGPGGLALCAEVDMANNEQPPNTTSEAQPTKKGLDDQPHVL